MAKDPVNILMTGGGAPGAAGILRCLEMEASFHPITADADPRAVGRYLAKGFETIPSAADVSFIDAILSLCRKKNIHIILPLVTKELVPLSKNISEFELAGARLPVSPTASLEIAINKSRLYEFLQWRGLSVPEFRVVETIGQFKTAAEELGFPGRTICFKPSDSNGSRGFRIISAKFNELDILLNHKPGSVFIRMEDAIRILNSGKFPELLISEYLPGDEYSVDCLANHGITVLALPRIREKMINGISVMGEFVNDGNIISYCRRIIQELKLHGNIGIQVKANDKGEWMVLEINPRVQGTISAAVGAGINFPVLSVKQELGLPISDEELKVKWGTKFSRYWNEVFY